MCDSVENVSGGLTGFFVGPEGDVGPRLTNGRTTGNISYTEELGGLAASDAVRIYRQIVGVSDIVLSCACTELRIPLQNRISREEAKKLYDETEGETVNIKGRYNNYARNVLSSYDEGYVNKEYIPHMQTAIRLGNIVFISFGYELFSEVGMRINEYATNCEVISLALANGSAGYFVTEAEIANGGYEVGMFLTTNIQPFVKHADWHLIKETMKAIKKVGVESCIE